MIKGLLFDLNGTVIDILTNEGEDQLYRVTSNFLDYYGVKAEPFQLKKDFFDLNRKQRHESKEEFPEFDVSKIFQEIIKKYQTVALEDITSLADTAAIVFRAASRYKLECYNGVSDCLHELKKRYIMAAVSDGQTLWAKAELRSTGLDEFFPTVLVSGDFGYRKPDRRLFEEALKAMNLQASEVVFVGNDMYRDVYGAHAAGMKTVFFKSNQGDHEYHGADADYIIYDFRELPKAIAFLENKLRVQRYME